MDISALKSAPVQPTQRLKSTDELQQAQNREAQAKEAEVKKPAESTPAPVVNTQGQTTGRLLNVTA